MNLPQTLEQPALQRLLARRHAQSEAQEATTGAWFSGRQHRRHAPRRAAG